MISSGKVALEVALRAGCHNICSRGGGGSATKSVVERKGSGTMFIVEGVGDKMGCAA